MRAKEVAAVESKAQNDLRNKYQNMIYNPNNKYLNKDYSSINSSARRNLNDQRKIIIDPTNNAQKLEEILGNKIVDSRHSKRKYQPLSENYRGIDHRPSLQMANPNVVPPSNQYNLIGRAGSRGSNLSSVTPHSGRKDALIVSKLKENYRNANISNHGYYIPPNGLRKMANLNSQRSQPVLSSLRNNLGKRYMSNQSSIENSRVKGLPPTNISHISNRGDLSSAKLRNRINSKHQYSVKPLSAKAPAWWG